MGKKGGGNDFQRTLLLATLIAAACGRTTILQDSECAPGDARICSAAGAVGAQTCTASGYWSECERASSEGSGTQAGSGGSVGTIGTGGLDAGTTPSFGGAPGIGMGGVGDEGGLGGGGAGEGGEAATGPTVAFGRTIGHKGTIEINDLSALPSGDFAIAAATYNGDVDFGAPTTPLTHEGGWDAIVAEFDSDGAPLRATLFGKGGDEVARSVAHDASGALITAETHAWSQPPGVRLKRTEASGAVAWSKLAQGHATADEVAIDGDGNVILAGVFATPVDFGGGALPTLGSTNTYVVKFDEQGNWLWGREFVGYGSTAAGIATDSAGNVLVVGSFAYHIDFGAGVVTGVGSSDLFVVKLSPTGELLFANTYAGNNHQDVGGVAVLSDDSFAIAGRFTGDLNIGAFSLHGSNAILVARFSATGQPLWAKPVESTSGQRNAAYDVAVDPSDNIVLVGTFQGTLLVPQPVKATKADAFVIGMHPSGDVRWTQVLGGPGEQDALTVATDAAGNVFVGGRFFDSIDFGEGPVSASGSLMDLFIAKIVP